MLNAFSFVLLAAPKNAGNPFLGIAFAVILAAIACIAVFYWFVYRKMPLDKKSLFLKKINLFSGISDFFRKEKEKSFFERKMQLVHELEVAEHKFMKRELLEENYRGIVRKKQQELIKIDSLLSKHAEKKPVSDFDLAGVEPKHRHLLKEILGEKQKCQEEMQLAQSRYLKRKIDEKTYQSVVNSCQTKLIELDGQVISLKTSQQIKNAFSELKEKLTAEQKNLAQKERLEIQRIAREILEQVEKSRSR